MSQIVRPLHQPVLLQEVIHYLSPQPGRVYVDGTFGRGGYAREILSRGAQLYGIDCDPEACAVGRLLETQNNQFKMIQGQFGDMRAHLAHVGHDQVDGIVLDLGVSSPQLDDAARGFSFQRDGPLDMRMSAQGPSAADLVNTLPEQELANVIYRYGEERRSRAIAAKLIAQRRIKPLETTLELAELVRSVVPRERQGFDPATRTFQALRIAVNDELGQLEHLLSDAQSLLKEGGRLIVVSFHSLEDRIVKLDFKEKAGALPGVNRHMPAPLFSPNKPEFHLLTKKGVQASSAEERSNPRARSAVLRAIEKTHDDHNI